MYIYLKVGVLDSNEPKQNITQCIDHEVILTGAALHGALLKLRNPGWVHDTMQCFPTSFKNIQMFNQ